jgi:hypothetical protein
LCNNNNNGWFAEIFVDPDSGFKNGTCGTQTQPYIYIIIIIVYRIVLWFVIKIVCLDVQTLLQQLRLVNQLICVFKKHSSPFVIKYYCIELKTCNDTNIYSECIDICRVATMFASRN